VSRAAQKWDEWEAWDDDVEAEAPVYTTTTRGRLAPAAAHPEPAPGPSPGPAPRRRRIRWGQLATVTVVGYLVIVGVSGEWTLVGVNRRADALSAQATSLAAANQALRHQIAMLHQRRYVDELARTQLGYASPGEVELVPTKVGHGAPAGRS
jgi:cell division protein FtsB